MRRGEVYLIKRRDTIGAEITKTRPAVIISNDNLNATSEVVEVIYLTTQPKKDLPTHVSVNATGVASLAICEQIDSVSTMLVCGKVGFCSEAEMAAIDRALLHSLGIEQKPANVTATSNKEKTQELSASEKGLLTELAKMQAERDRYAKMVDTLLAVVEP
jgi:mRNA interferase MazF